MYWITFMVMGAEIIDFVWPAPRIYIFYTYESDFWNFILLALLDGIYLFGIAHAKLAFIPLQKMLI